MDIKKVKEKERDIAHRKNALEKSNYAVTNSGKELKSSLENSKKDCQVQEGIKNDKENT